MTYNRESSFDIPLCRETGWFTFVDCDIQLAFANFRKKHGLEAAVALAQHFRQDLASNLHFRQWKLPKFETRPKVIVQNYEFLKTSGK